MKIFSKIVKGCKSGKLYFLVGFFRWVKTLYLLGFSVVLQQTSSRSKPWARVSYNVYIIFNFYFSPKEKIINVIYKEDMNKMYQFKF